MKKFTHLKCSKCSREKKELINLKSFTPDKCNITLSCDGRLFPIAYTSSPDRIPDSTELPNWRNRNITISTSSIQEESTIPLGVGEYQQIFIAVNLPSTPIQNSSISLKFIGESQNIKSYRQYTFRPTSGIKIVSGVESGVQKKVLRYTTNDIVEVYVDGVKRPLGSQDNGYYLFDNVNNLTPNTIQFNNPLSGSKPQVDVVVTSTVTQSSITIPFTRCFNDEAKLNTSAWEGVDFVYQNSSSTKWYLFKFELSSNYSLLQNFQNVKFVFDSSSPISSTNTSVVTPDNIMFLLSTGGNTKLDREKNVIINLSNIKNPNYLMFTKSSTNFELVFNENLVDSIYPPLSTGLFAANSSVTLNSDVRDGFYFDNLTIIGEL